MRAGVDAAPLAKLAGTIDAATMIAMNAEVEIDGRSFAETAREVPRRRLRAGRLGGRERRCRRAGRAMPPGRA